MNYASFVYSGLTSAIPSATEASSAEQPLPTHVKTSEGVNRTKLSPELRLLAVSGTCQKAN